MAKSMSLAASLACRNATSNFRAHGILLEDEKNKYFPSSNFAVWAAERTQENIHVIIIANIARINSLFIVWAYSVSN